MKSTVKRIRYAKERVAEPGDLIFDEEKGVKIDGDPFAVVEDKNFIIIYYKTT